MNRKELDILARKLKSAKPDYVQGGDDFWAGWCSAVDAVANAVQATTANFDREKFLNRCDYE